MLMGVGTLLLIMSAALSFLTHGCPSIYLTPPKDPSLFFGSLTNRPYRSILI
jgi:hypothetical protein